MRSLTMAVLAMAALCAGGCVSEGDEGVDVTEDAVRVRPAGTPPTNGEFVFNVPPGFKAEFAVGPYNYAYTFTLNGGSLVKPGQVLVLNRSREPDPDFKDCLNVTLTRRLNARPSEVRVTRQQLCGRYAGRGQRTTIEFGVAKLWWTGYPQAWMGPTDLVLVQGTPKLLDAAGEAQYVEGPGSFMPQGYAFNGTNDIPLLLPPGKYTYAPSGERSRFGSKDFEVKALQQTDVDFGLDSNLAKVEVSQTSDAAEFGTFHLSRSLVCGGTTLSYDGKFLGNPITSRVLIPGAETRCKLVSNPDPSTRFKEVSMPFTLKPGQELKLQFKRLDIDDVHLSDGRVTEGTVNVRRKNEDGSYSAWLFDRPLKSRVGMYLPPGHYQVKSHWYAGESIDEIDL